MISKKMVSMETPKCRRLRRVKGTSKKKKNVLDDELSEPKNDVHGDVGTSTTTCNITPPRISKCVTIVERGQEEIRGVVWQYHEKFVESDIPVVWGSPHGSPVVDKIPSISPLHRPKRRTVSCVPKTLNSEESEPPQFLNEILALSEKLKTEGKKSEESLKSPKNNGKEPVGDVKELDESFSNFFDEDMNECMIQCSQELEQDSLKNMQVAVDNKRFTSSCNEDQRNKQRVISDPISSSSCRRLSDSDVSKSSIPSDILYLKDDVTQSDASSSRVGSKNYVHCKRKTNTYVYQGRILGKHGNAETRSQVLVSGSSGYGQAKKNNSFEIKQSSSNTVVLAHAPKIEKTSDLNRSQASSDNSFETVKESFLDEDLEFLSTIPDDIEMVAQLEKTKSSKRRSLGSSEPKQQNMSKLPNAGSIFDDSTYFEDGVLQYLDSIESNVGSSQPLTCTPEEIEKKRQEAKLKLQKRKHSVKKL